MSKLRKSKSEQLSKSRNLSHFCVIKTGLNFLTFDAREAFYYLWLAFTKAIIFCYFDLKYYIQIETDVSAYAISKMLSQQTLKLVMIG